MAYKTLIVKKKAAKKVAKKKETRMGRPPGKKKRLGNTIEEMPFFTSLPEEEKVLRIHTIMKKLHAEEHEILKLYPTMSGGEKKASLIRLQGIVEEIGIMKLVIDTLDRLSPKKAKKVKGN